MASFFSGNWFGIKNLTLIASFKLFKLSSRFTWGLKVMLEWNHHFYMTYIKWKPPCNQRNGKCEWNGIFCEEKIFRYSLSTIKRVLGASETKIVRLKRLIQFSWLLQNTQNLLFQEHHTRAVDEELLLMSLILNGWWIRFCTLSHYIHNIHLTQTVVSHGVL